MFVREGGHRLVADLLRVGGSSIGQMIDLQSIERRWLLSQTVYAHKCCKDILHVRTTTAATAASPALATSSTSS